MLTSNLPAESTSDPLPEVECLRMRTSEGSCYIRPSEINEQITDLFRLNRNEFIERIQCQEANARVHSECLLYFIRRPPFDSEIDVLNALFIAIRQRVLHAVPVPKVVMHGESNRTSERSVDLEIRDAVLDKFQELLCRDLHEYQERLDYLECRFNSGIHRLRATARRDILKRRMDMVPLPGENGASELNPEIEKALVCISDAFDGPRVDFLYRSKIFAAINSLPLDERQVIELLLQGFPIDSQDSEKETMVTILECCEKTVRNRLKRAFAKLADLLKEGDA